MTERKEEEMHYEVMLENGHYEAIIVGGARVYENDKGTLVCLFTVDIGQLERKVFLSMTKKDGTANEFVLKRLMKLYPEWNGDPAWLTESEHTGGQECIAEVVNEGGWSNVKSIRHPDDTGSSNGNSNLPESMNKQQLTAKYAGKFRAMMGGTPVKK